MTPRRHQFHAIDSDGVVVVVPVQGEHGTVWRSGLVEALEFLHARSTRKRVRDASSVTVLLCSGNRKLGRPRPIGVTLSLVEVTGNLTTKQRGDLPSR